MAPQEQTESQVEEERGEIPALMELLDFQDFPDDPEIPEREENQVVLDDPETEESPEAPEDEESPVMLGPLDSPVEVEREDYLDDLVRLDTPYLDNEEPLEKTVPLVPLDFLELVELLVCPVRGEELDDLGYPVNRVLMGRMVSVPVDYLA